MAAVPNNDGSQPPPDSPAPSVESVFPSPPFTESNPRADLILETADGDRFFVVKAILIQASPVFETMLSLPQPTVSEDPNEQEFDGDLPVVKVTEKSSALDTLLRISYPIRSPQLNSVDLTEIGDVLQAALKYDVDGAVFEIRNALNAPRFRDPINALAVFVMAYRNGWKEDAQRAARDTLKGPPLYAVYPCVGYCQSFRLSQIVTVP
ncbi:hypothetical protein BD410DRAFT_532423 [Rickenella mellea]|uniref:BTB domain-containing protein n=1 Tax=Rickenella mellea TaxID=50990 RepID=A0A4Y7QHZ9_9AGAM|nr:hypothetical protein BD410DRAFT_532423 [Rickenella mellea]